MKSLYVFILLFLLSLSYPLFPQPIRGIPFIRNYSSREYSGGTDNWSVVQDKRGVMYFGNSNGILEYDGVRWNRFSVSNSSIVRSLDVDSNGILYAGAVGDFGYMNVNKSGGLDYHSLVSLLSDGQRVFGDVWKTYATPYGVFFQTFDKLFLYQKGRISVFNPENSFHLSFFINGNYYINSRGTGLKIYRENSLRLVKGGDFFADKRIYVMLPFPENRLLIATRESGFFLLQQNSSSGESPQPVPFVSGADEYIRHNQVYGGTVINDSVFAIATLRGGVVILNIAGEVKSVINKQIDLQNDNVKYLYPDRQGGLWMALDDGISRAEILSPVRMFNDMTGLKGAVQAIAGINDVIYAGTVQGVFYLGESPSEFVPGDADELARLSDCFRPVEGIASQCWDLFTAAIGTEKKLLAATTEGVFEISDARSKRINDAYSFALHQSRKNPGRIFIGKQNGISSFYHNNNSWTDEGALQGMEHEIRSIAEDTNGNLWLGVPFYGIFEIVFKGEPGSSGTFYSASWGEQYSIRSFDTSSGLPSLRYDNAFETGGNPLFGTDKGLLKFDYGNGKFVWEKNYGTMYADGSRQVFCFAPQDTTKTWLYSANEKIGEVSMSVTGDTGNPLIIRQPFKPLNEFEIHTIFPQRGGSVWLGSTRGLLEYNIQMEKNFRLPFNAFVRKVIAGKDSVIFYGTFAGEDGTLSSLTQLSFQKPVLRYGLNSISFEFSACNYDNDKNNLYRWYLEGFDNGWTAWSQEAKTHYNNLSEGDYIFHVVSQNIYETQSAEAVYAFTILPPWYRTLWAYFAYVLLLISLIYVSIQISLRRLRKAKIHLENVVRERTAEVVKQKEEIELQKVLLEKKNKDITDSINYARRIQEAILPREEFIRAHLPESFVLFKPKDIVSGDFYWVAAPPTPPKGGSIFTIDTSHIDEKSVSPIRGDLVPSPKFSTKDEGGFLFTASDCTGHGVPGAFMSMLCSSLLNKAVIDKGMTQPARILDDVRRGVIEALRQRGISGEQKDGMDSTLCSINFETLSLQFAGANNPLFLLRKGITASPPPTVAKTAFHGEDLLEIKADKQPVAISDNLKPFTNNEIQLQKGDVIYLLSDGYEDQFGGPQGKKFKIKQLKDLLLAICDKPMPLQKEILDNTIEEWRRYKDEEGNAYEQIDDIVVMGVRV